MSKCEGHHHTSRCGVMCILLCLLFHIHIHSCHDADMDVTAPPTDGAIQIKKGNTTTNTSLHINFLEKIFTKYADGNDMTFEGFEHLLQSLKLSSLHIHDHILVEHFINGSFREKHPDHNHSHCNYSSQSHHTEQHVSSKPSKHKRRSLRPAVINDTSQQSDRELPKCLSAKEILSNYDMSIPLSKQSFTAICPALVALLDSQACEEVHRQKLSERNKVQTTVFNMSLTVWGYAFVSVLVISLVGLLCVAVIPLTTKVFYNHLLQFLVALAVGSLTGDACLHLLPHAMYPHTHASDSHKSPGDHESHDSGHASAAMYKGLVMLGGIYFFFLTERVMGLVTERKRKNNKKKREQSPPNYKPVQERERDVGAKLSGHTVKVMSCEAMLMVPHPSKDIKNLSEDAHDEVHENCELDLEDAEQVRGHTQGHGHSHGPLPSSVSSVAWMVIMGDGMHNFSDGLAIGAAYANSLSGGLSTTVAVFCHELPHELGDFAVLLRAGMSPKQAIIYNLVSSVLSLFGMVVGVAVGNFSEASLWIFALIGGSFLYVAMVDMLPELSAVDPKAGEHPLVHLLLQNIGLLCGASVMFVIAMYEDQIKIPHWEP